VNFRRWFPKEIPFWSTYLKRERSFMKNPDAESRRWLEQAQYDLKTSQWNAKGELFAPACFWAQQAAEKAAKAYLYSRGERLVTGHSVAELLERCKAHDEEFDSLITVGAFLDRFYIPTRYPNSLGSIYTNTRHETRTRFAF
jgi:HEPN domain-containing protein